MGEKGYKIIARNRGAVERNLDIIEKFVMPSCGLDPAIRMP